ncbi:conserved hypothetical protein [Coccidioides posadasii str. Silveira]|uniref:Uncharacterized protein n=1 Tax=Coccidioides posadasii (strain RMSCC 757 / Silveira) TaxID=443226 RepID=E9D942_COCPS|nr:conserved hypothetical protein [Coccidioides posadasii str. Silveira]
MAGCVVLLKFAHLPSTDRSKTKFNGHGLELLAPDLELKKCGPPKAQPQHSRSQSGSAGADTKNTRQMTIPESGSAWKIGVEQGDKSSDGQRTCGSDLSALATFPFGDEKGHRAEQFQKEID